MSVIIKQVTGEDDVAAIYKLRYKIYCLEWGFESPGNHSNRMVSDEYDEDALHFVAQNDYQKVVGAIMLILNSEKGYPLEKYCEVSIEEGDIPRDKLAEISRLVIHRDYRRRSEDKYIYGPDEERRSIGSFHFPSQYQNHKTYYRRAEDKYKYKQSARRTGDMYNDRRRRHEVLIGLYKAVYQTSKKRGISHWYSVMTKGIVTLLNKYGFSFEAIGDPVDYHGIRTPYLAEIAKLEEEMSVRNPYLYEEFTKDI